MIIFDLDGTLANCEHRRHFVDPYKNNEYEHTCFEPLIKNNLIENWGWFNKKGEKFKPDWKAFNEACDKDEPIKYVIKIFRYQMTRYSFKNQKNNWQIWSGRCESVRKKTEEWLDKHIICSVWGRERLKMRPIGDNTPDDQLKERWLDELIKNCPNTYDIAGSSIENRPYPIEMVFDASPKVIRMWRRRGIFVFDCNQTGEEF